MTTTPTPAAILIRVTDTAEALDPNNETGRIVHRHAVIPGLGHAEVVDDSIRPTLVRAPDGAGNLVAAEHTVVAVTMSKAQFDAFVRRGCAEKRIDLATGKPAALNPDGTLKKP